MDLILGLFHFEKAQILQGRHLLFQISVEGFHLGNDLQELLPESRQLALLHFQETTEASLKSTLGHKECLEFLQFLEIKLRLEALVLREVQKRTNILDLEASH